MSAFEETAPAARLRCLRLMFLTPRDEPLPRGSLAGCAARLSRHFEEDGGDNPRLATLDERPAARLDV